MDTRYEKLVCIQVDFFNPSHTVTQYTGKKNYHATNICMLVVLEAQFLKNVF